MGEIVVAALFVGQLWVFFAGRNEAIRLKGPTRGDLIWMRATWPTPGGFRLRRKIRQSGEMRLWLLAEANMWGIVAIIVAIALFEQIGKWI